jgi:hypothetical protein
MMDSVRAALFWSAAIACVIAQIAIVRSTLVAIRTPTGVDGLSADASQASATDDRRRPLPAQHQGAELLWVALPTIALAWLFVAGYRLAVAAG